MKIPKKKKVILNNIQKRIIQNIGEFNLEFKFKQRNTAKGKEDTHPIWRLVKGKTNLALSLFPMTITD